MIVHLLNGVCDGSLVTVSQQDVLPLSHNKYDILPENTFTNYVIDAYNSRKLINHIETMSPMRHIWRLTGVNLRDVEMPAINPAGTFLCCSRDVKDSGWIYTVHFKEYEMEEGDIDGWEVENRMDG